MQFPGNFDLKPANILKITGLALVAIIVIVLAFRLIGSSFNSLSRKVSLNNSASQGAPAFDSEVSYLKSEEMAYGVSGGAAGLSVRNVVSTTIPSPGKATTGDDAEALEVTEYNASIETRQLTDTCAKITAWKSRADVIFENANEYEHGCNYTFKVKRDSVGEILAALENLNPKELNANTYTIKNLVDDYTSEVEILKKKQSSIEETLTDAVNAYNGITKLATRIQDVESLAKIIDSKIGVIERLTQERINVNAQLDRLERSQAEQLDRLDYTYFNIRITENKLIDGQNLKDSWKTALKSFVRDINVFIQDITVNLVALLFLALQYIIYFFILLIIAKYGWQLAKHIWLK
ncbi:MAG: hypothetical protein WC458_03410 [Patescibacteria group bacterium]